MTNDSKTLLRFVFQLLKTAITYADLKDQMVLSPLIFQKSEQIQYEDSQIELATRILDQVQSDTKFHVNDIDFLADGETDGGFPKFNDRISASAFAMIANIMKYEDADNHFIFPTNDGLDDYYAVD
jgi:hypothetical protein